MSHALRTSRVIPSLAPPGGFWPDAPRGSRQLSSLVWCGIFPWGRSTGILPLFPVARTVPDKWARRRLVQPFGKKLLLPSTASKAGVAGGLESDYVGGEGATMKTKTVKLVEQPVPVTPGITKGMVRQHAYMIYRDKLPDHPLTLEDWVLAEKDLVATLEAENLPK